jgi:hypothetical protein
MEETGRDAVLKLIQLYTSGQSSNAADAQYLHHKHGLPGEVLENSVANVSIRDHAKSQHLSLLAEKEQQHQRTNLLLERQRYANAKEKMGYMKDKVDYSAMQSEVDFTSAKNSTISIASAISRCSKIVLEIDKKYDAAGDVPCIENEEREDLQGSMQKLTK